MRKSRTQSEALLVADIGGTNARFGIWYKAALHNEQVYKCGSYPGPAEAAGAYLKQIRANSSLPVPRAAAFAIAGPLLDDRVVITNNKWDFSAAATRHALGLERLILLNDFTALALAVPQLAASERFQVGGAAPLADAAIAVIGPGTGLGVSGLLRESGRWLALAGEGGHATLPVVDAREMAVVTALHQRYSHVSAERILSGDGLELLYRTLAELDGAAVAALPAGEITEHALAGTDARCRETVDLFCGWLGNVAGNLALTLGARGGVYIGGGIVPRFGGYFAASPFRQRFEAKGRYAQFLATLPVFVITAKYPALIGCVQAFEHSSPRLEAG
ncbi:MAG TPA: glucokinase [Steroidobacteraceae bacterium]|nr:glucokinase [Steroidobacteraceae bacterium]